MRQWNQSGGVYDQELKEERIILGILMTGLLLSGIAFGFYGVTKTIAAVQPRYTISIQCRIPDPGKQMPVFAAKPLSDKESLSLGTGLGDAVGAVFDGISYTHSGSNFLDTNPEGGVHLITVSNKDGSYTYRGTKGLSGYMEEGDSAAVKNALRKLSVSVPSYAVFVREENGWFSFTAEESWSENSLVCGSLRCRFSKDGTLVDLENNIVTYVSQGVRETISAEALLKKLQKGTYLKELLPKDAQQIHIIAARIRYRQTEENLWEPYMVLEIASQDRAKTQLLWAPLLIDTNETGKGWHGYE